VTKHETIGRPTLAPGVRYRWDDIRQQHQLLFPEGMLVLNESGAAIVQRCDGRSAEAIREQLAKLVSHGQLDDDVDEFLSRLATRGWINDADTS